MKTSETPASAGKWLVTGAAGFIGSHIVKHLLEGGESVVGFDNLSTGKAANLDEVRSLVGDRNAARLEWVEGDVENPDSISAAAAGCRAIIHEAALGSVPLSLEKPLKTHASNATGFLHVLEAARANGIRRVVYASSSAVYGNCPELPLRESSAGDVLSPYAASKLIDEIYARTYASAYGLELVGLRYFNVFGPRQDPNGAYAAVIPRWIQALLDGTGVIINGSGENTRDFCYVQDVVQANILAATCTLTPGTSLALNVGGGHRISLLELFDILADRFRATGGTPGRPTHGPARPGDILHSMADVSAAEAAIGFRAEHALESSLHQTFDWFAARHSKS